MKKEAVGIKTTQKSPPAQGKESAKLFTKEELDATIEKETKLRIKELMSKAKKQHDDEKKELLDQLQRYVASSMGESHTTDS